MTEPASVARVDLAVQDNGTWQDAFQFGTAGDTTWSFSNKTFHMDVKASSDDVAALFSLTTAAGTIVVDSVVLRILHFNVPEAVLEAALAPGQYVYDLVMIDASVPPIRVPLMRGHVRIKHGVTQS